LPQKAEKIKAGADLALGKSNNFLEICPSWGTKQNEKQNENEDYSSTICFSFCFSSFSLSFSFYGKYAKAE
jgi:hypothetical protein